MRGGNISACEMLPSFGNIKNKSIKNLMNSEEYKKQVESIKKKGMPLYTQLFVDNISTFNPAKWPNLIYQKNHNKKRF